jgi:hypothetical protein
MAALSEKMKRISQLSSDLSTQFSENRQTANELTESNRTIKSLQSIVSLPQKLRTLINEKNYREAIRIYSLAKPKLEKIKNFPSVQGIYKDSKTIIEKLERQVTLNFINCCTTISAVVESRESSTIFGGFLGECQIVA